VRAPAVGSAFAAGAVGVTVAALLPFDPAMPALELELLLELEDDDDADEEADPEAADVVDAASAGVDSRDGTVA
jgi:hypothetical protein